MANRPSELSFGAREVRTDPAPQEELRRLRALVETANLGFWDWNLHTQRVFYSDVWKRQLGCDGIPLREHIEEWQRRIHVQDRERALELVRAFIAEPWGHCKCELRMQHANGTHLNTLMHLTPVLDGQGKPERLLASQLDITDSTRAELDLKERAGQLALCIEHCPAPIAMFDRDMRYLAVSRKWSDEYRLPRSLIGRSHYDIFPEIPQRWREIHQRCLQGATESCEEDPFPRADGTLDWIRWEIHPWRTASGDVGGIVIFSERITERKRLERESRERESRMHLLFDAVPHMITVLESSEHGVTYANATWRDYYGHDLDAVTPEVRMKLVHPDDRATASTLRAQVAAELARPAAGAVPKQLGPHMIRMFGKDGAYRWFSVQTSCVPAHAEQPGFVIATATDVHALKQSEDSLSEAQARLQAALRAGGIGLLVWEVPAGRIRWDESLLRVLGRTREDLESRSISDMMQLVHEDDRDLVYAAGARALEHGESLELECRVLRPDGSVACLAVKGCAERHAQGQPLRMIAAVVDITERKQLEAEVLQAQKMDAIGQLAGGIAHDFNNLLTVILGQLSLLQLEGNISGTLGSALQDIHQAADRAAALTRQLLAFGRRQLMQARAADLNVLVAETLKMLRRIVGENITLEFEPAPQPVIARVDATMLSQMLLNLTVNARDATERGGRCIIRTSTQDLDEAAAARLSGAKSGRWACVSVADTGAGIAPDVLPHVFEPFFTTKKLGQGTGLGLSMVYGILKQHGGFVHVESALGRGTLVQAFLPWVEAAPQLEPERTASARPEHPRAAKILLAEDEPAVRAVTRAMLAQRGHRVTMADDAHEALRLWREHNGDFDLLLTDMMMPGMTGLELIETLRKEKPDLKAILCSGYSLDIALAKSAGPVQQVALLQKPWKAEALHRCVEEMLGQVAVERSL